MFFFLTQWVRTEYRKVTAIFRGKKLRKNIYGNLPLRVLNGAVDNSNRKKEGNKT